MNSDVGGGPKLASRPNLNNEQETKSCVIWLAGEFQVLTNIRIPRIRMLVGAQSSPADQNEWKT